MKYSKTSAPLSISTDLQIQLNRALQPYSKRQLVNGCKPNHQTSLILPQCGIATIENNTTLNLKLFDNLQQNRDNQMLIDLTTFERSIQKINSFRETRVSVLRYERYDTKRVMVVNVESKDQRNQRKVNLYLATESEKEVASVSFTDSNDVLQVSQSFQIQKDKSYCWIIATIDGKCYLLVATEENNEWTMKITDINQINRVASVFKTIFKPLMPPKHPYQQAFIFFRHFGDRPSLYTFALFDFQLQVHFLNLKDVPGINKQPQWQYNLAQLLPVSVRSIFYAQMKEIKSNNQKLYLVCYEKDLSNQKKYVSIYELDIEINSVQEKRITIYRKKERIIMDNGLIENLTVQSTDRYLYLLYCNQQIQTYLLYEYNLESAQDQYHKLYSLDVGEVGIIKKFQNQVYFVFQSKVYPIRSLRGLSESSGRPSMMVEEMEIENQDRVDEKERRQIEKLVDEQLDQQFEIQGSRISRPAMQEQYQSQAFDMPLSRTQKQITWDIKSIKNLLQKKRKNFKLLYENEDNYEEGFKSLVKSLLLLEAMKMPEINKKINEFSGNQTNKGDGEQNQEGKTPEKVLKLFNDLDLNAILEFLRLISESNGYEEIWVQTLKFMKDLHPLFKQKQQKYGDVSSLQHYMYILLCEIYASFSDKNIGTLLPVFMQICYMYSLYDPKLHLSDDKDSKLTEEAMFPIFNKNSGQYLQQLCSLYLDPLAFVYLFKNDKLDFNTFETFMKKMLYEENQNTAIELIQQFINFEIQQKLPLTSLAWSWTFQPLHAPILEYLKDRAPHHYLLFGLSIKKAQLLNEEQQLCRIKQSLAEDSLTWKILDLAEQVYK